MIPDQLVSQPQSEFNVGAFQRGFMDTNVSIQDIPQSHFHHEITSSNTSGRQIDVEPTGTQGCNVRFQ